MYQDPLNEQETSPLNCFSIVKPLVSNRNPIFHVYDKKFNRHVALKTFPFGSSLQKSYLREKEHLMRLNHPYIVQLYEAEDSAISTIELIKEKKVSYLVLEYAPYGDMLDIVSRCSKIPEILARTLFHQLIEVIGYLHLRNVAHMDLKLDNLLISEDFQLRLIDFDLSQPLDSLYLEANGTPGYRAPEVKKGICSYLQAADIYSAAVILFIMVSGHPPYSEVNKGDGAEYDAYYRLLRNNITRFWEVHTRHKKIADFYCEDFKFLIGWMLAEEPRDRPTIEEIKASKWYNGPVLTREEFRNAMKKYLCIQ